METRNQRASVLGLALSSLLVLPTPGSGVGSTGARRHLLGLYAGVDGAVVDLPEGTHGLRFAVEPRDLFFEV